MMGLSTNPNSKMNSGSENAENSKHKTPASTQRIYLLGCLPLEMFAPNEDGDLYDGTVNRKRAEEYAKRPLKNVEDAPPVIALLSPRSGLLRIHDGGHRITAARMRGDFELFALVGVRGVDLEKLKHSEQGDRDRLDRSERVRPRP